MKANKVWAASRAEVCVTGGLALALALTLALAVTGDGARNEARKKRL